MAQLYAVVINARDTFLLRETEPTFGQNQWELVKNRGTPNAPIKWFRSQGTDNPASLFSLKNFYELHAHDIVIPSQKGELKLGPITSINIIKDWPNDRPLDAL